VAEEAGYARARAAAANAPLLSPTRDLGHLIGLLIAGIGFLIGSRRLSDNSFLTHLATGREMIAHGFVHSDVFTWTAEGHHVVVQSWLASAALGLVDKIAGGTGIRLVIALTAAALAGLSWSLTQRSPSVSTRVLVMLPVLVIGAEMWTERPLLLALVLFGLTLLVTEGERSVAGLSIVGFIWVGVHGSWPLGLVLLAARAAGARLDNTSSEREVRAFGWLLAGVLVGGTVNPYGPRLLIFPVELLGRRETLSRVTEWGSPSFDATYTKAFLLLLVMMVVSATRRSNWRSPPSGDGAGVGLTDESEEHPDRNAVVASSARHGASAAGRHLCSGHVKGHPKVGRRTGDQFGSTPVGHLERVEFRPLDVSDRRRQCHGGCRHFAGRRACHSSGFGRELHRVSLRPDACSVDR